MHCQSCPAIDITTHARVSSSTVLFCNPLCVLGFSVSSVSSYHRHCHRPRINWSPPFESLFAHSFLFSSHSFLAFLILFLLIVRYLFRTRACRLITQRVCAASGHRCARSFRIRLNRTQPNKKIGPLIEPSQLNFHPFDPRRSLGSWEPDATRIETLPSFLVHMQIYPHRSTRKRLFTKRKPRARREADKRVDRFCIDVSKTTENI